MDGGRSLVELLEREFDRRVVLTVLVAEAGQETTADISFRIPADPEGFELGIVPQPELRPALISVTAVLGEGRTVISSSPGVTIRDGALTYQGTPTTPIAIWARTRA